MRNILTIIFCLSVLLASSQDYSIWYINGTDTTLVKNGTDSAFTTSFVYVAKVRTGDRPMSDWQTKSTSFTGKQPLLVSGTTIKTINGSSLLGSGNLTISGASWGSITGTLSSQTDLQNALNLKATLASPTFTGTVAGITSTMVGLGNVTNESKGTMFTSPTFTGTVSGVTATMVGLGNVTNESKATMHTNATFTGTFDVANGSIANADLANGAVANLSGTNTGDQTSIVGITGTLAQFNTAITDGNIGTGDAVVASGLNQFASTTSAQLAGVLSDEVGTLGGFKREASIKLGSDYTNNSTTGTEITGLQISSTGTGLLNFEYWLLVRSAATTTGWKIGINHTGTATVLSLNMTYPSTGGAAATGVGEDVVINNTGSIYEASANTAASTTAPNLGPTAGVAATGQNVLVKVFGLLNVTVSGDLEIWAGSEIAASQISVMTNSFGTANLR